MDLLSGLGNQKMPSCIQYPFDLKSIKAIRIHFSKSYFNESWSASGTIEFKNNNTEAKQEFEGKTIDEIIQKIKACLETI